MAAPKIPRQVKSRMVKDNILATATMLIREHGYEFVTVSNVCQAAGVSTGSFYHHFENKDQLLAYYLVAAFEKQAQEFTSFPDDNVVANIVRCYDLYADFLLEQGFEFVKNYYTTQNKSLSTDSAKDADIKVAVPILDKTVELISDAVRSGDMAAEVDADELGEDLCLLEKGVIFDWCLCDGRHDLKEKSRRIMKIYLHSFMTPHYFERFPETYSVK
jgi:AcrR family transcriptional regulator